MSLRHARHAGLAGFAGWLKMSLFQPAVVKIAARSALTALNKGMTIL
jgi:hypothetical protein